MSEDPTPAGNGCDVVAVGEAMALVTPTEAVPLERADHAALGAGGAESNVAIHLARLGYRARWVSRVGDDPLGRLVLRHIGSAGVDVDAVTVDRSAKTGVYFKDPGTDGTRVHYYRDGSAASRMGPDVLADPRVTEARILHVSGVTAALSTSCLDLIDAAVRGASTRSSLVSFDVNHRPALWPAGRAASVLAELADASDLVFVGLDEARSLWGCGTSDEVRALLPSPATVVVKDGAVGAWALTAAGTTFVPALKLSTVEAVGAGDAFAAGYLAGMLEDATETTCLRFGHLVASLVLQVTGDHAPLPPRSWFDDRLALAPDAWEALEPDGPAAG